MESAAWPTNTQSAIPCCSSQSITASQSLPFSCSVDAVLLSTRFSIPRLNDLKQQRWPEVTKIARCWRLDPSDRA